MMESRMVIESKNRELAGMGSRLAIDLGGELPIIFDQFSNSFASLALALIAFPDKKLCGGPLSDAKSERLEGCVG